MRVVLGVTGGIAAYKATGIIRLLTEAGHDVKVIPTANALRFIGATTLEALSHNSVDPDLYTDVESVKHVDLGQSADLVVVAPASAAFLARLATGLADDLLMNTLLATKAPILVAPAMHTEMWQNEATVANVATLRTRGIEVLDPAVGRLTGADSGPGRLPEADEIVAAALSLVTYQDLAGKRILITAGGTQEPIDPVRFLGNHSSGKQGIALAEQATKRGAGVTLIAANVTEAIPGIDKVVHVSTASELAAAVDAELSDVNAIIMTAAVADFRVEVAADKKLKRSELGNEINLKLVANPDILAGVVARTKDEKLRLTTVGFAAETASDINELQRLAEHKLEAKGCDILVANNVSAGAVFGADNNSVLVLTKHGSVTARDGSKRAIADHILDVLGQEI
ncbi:MAG: bifunctional phosphopantothenoylcysteine decarboxylase/phosphopantothenate--cysteine ligase CoaBC [Rhodoluna sp.]